MSITVNWALKVFTFEESPFVMVEEHAGEYITLNISPTFGDPANRPVLLVALQVITAYEDMMDVGYSSSVKLEGGEVEIGGTYFVPAVYDENDMVYKLFCRFDDSGTYYRVAGVFNPKILDLNLYSVIVGGRYSVSEVAWKLSDSLVPFEIDGQSWTVNRAVYQTRWLLPETVSYSQTYGCFCYVKAWEESVYGRTATHPHLHPTYTYPHAQTAHIYNMTSITYDASGEYPYGRPWGFPTFLHPTFTYNPEEGAYFAEFFIDFGQYQNAPTDIYLDGVIWLRNDAVLPDMSPAIKCCSPTRDVNGVYRVPTFTTIENGELTKLSYDEPPTERSGCLFLQDRFIYMETNLNRLLQFLGQEGGVSKTVPRATSLAIGM